jgi:hypothetical protein
MPRIEDSQYPVEDLKDLRLFINEKGRPTSDMTEKIWQRIFALRKEQTIPLINGSKRRMKVIIDRAIVNEWGEYCEDTTTDWKRYCNFINDVLREIRMGKVANCFYYYQIMELLRFHKDDLETQYNKEEKYWEVWLNGKQS